MDAPMKTKICSKCPEKGPQPLSAFYPRKDRPGRFSSWCKSCLNTAREAWKTNNREHVLAKKRQHRAASLERYQEQLRIWRATHKEHERAYRLKYAEENCEKIAARNRKWYQEHAGERHLYAVAYYAAHREQRIATVKQWKGDNPKQWAINHRNAQSRRRARKKNGPIVETVDLDVLYERDKGVCGLCGKPVKRSDASRDHIVPISQGGAHAYTNCVLAHLDCNRKKGIKRIPQQLGLL